MPAAGGGGAMGNDIDPHAVYLHTHLCEPWLGGRTGPAAGGRVATIFNFSIG